MQGAYPMPAMAGKGQHRADGGRAEVPAFGRAQGSAIGQGLADLFGEFLEGKRLAQEGRVVVQDDQVVEQVGA